MYSVRTSTRCRSNASHRLHVRHPKLHGRGSAGCLGSHLHPAIRWPARRASCDRRVLRQKTGRNLLNVILSRRTTSYHRYMTNLFVRKLGLRVALSEEDERALIDATRKTLKIAPGRDVVSEGDKPEFAHILLDGFACRYRGLSDGGRTILAYLVPGDGCDLHASILPRMPHSIATLTPCVVAQIPYRTIKELAAYRPSIYLALWWSVIVDEAMLQESLVGSGRRSASKQVAHFLCEVITRLQAVGVVSGDDCRLHISQAELADTAGLSLMHIHRVLTELKKSSLIKIGQKAIIVPDISMLKRFCEFDPSYLYLADDKSARKSEAPIDLSRATRNEYEARFGSRLGNAI